MEKLLELFKIMQLTRNMPQYGYVLAGIPQDELSNLASHHYLVTLLGWQLALAVQNKGSKINAYRVMQLCMVHDLGELFGGDIAQPYARVNPEAKKAARAFENINHQFLLQFFAGNEDLVKELFAEVMDPKSDEAYLFKIVDNLECILFKLQAGFKDWDIPALRTQLMGPVEKISDIPARRYLSEFVSFFVKNFREKTAHQIITGD